MGQFKSGSADTIYDQIGNIPSLFRSSFDELITQTQITQTATDYNTSNSRNIGDYDILMISLIVEDYIREGTTIPRNTLTYFGSTGTSLRTTTGGVDIEVVIRYKSATKIEMKYNASATKNVKVRIDALKLKSA